MLALAKILPVFVLPLGVTFILLAIGLFRKRRAFIIAAVLLLYVSSNPLVARWLTRAVEGGLQRGRVEEAATADAIVGLSAGRVLAPGPARVAEWADPDRFFAGVELYQAGKAPLLVFTGAPIADQPGALLEGQLLKQTAERMGVPADRVVSTGLVHNTAMEAEEVARLLRQRHPDRQPRILLVTSAFHMPRARMLFETQGLAVAPFPVDYQHSAAPRAWIYNVLPTPDSLAQTQYVLREVYGRLYYRLRAVF